MTRPAKGLQTFHNGRPVELLYLVAADREGQTWRVRPIFVADETERDELFRAHDTLRPIHTAIKENARSKTIL